MPGVTVAVKGTSLGVATDVNGNFQIQMPPATNWIFVFSFIGMQTVEIQSGDRREFEVVLKPAKEELEEVVVTGYKTIREERAKRLPATRASFPANQIAGRGLQSSD